MVKNLLEKIHSKQAVVGIIGLGYVGLPLLVQFVKKGFQGIGFDIDSKKVNSLLHGESYIKHVAIEPINKFLNEKRLDVTISFDRIQEADCLLICVPTPLTDKMEPDLRFLNSTTETIARFIRPGQLVVLESTTYPGTTEEMVLPVLSQNNMRVGHDFFLAFSPEREDPGNKDFHTGNIPKVVGGVTENCLKIAVALYEEAIDKVIGVSSTRVAELTKLLENIYRCVNIALVNELKVLSMKMGIDIWEVIEAASTKPFGFTPFYPGPGLGGHCIPIDPFYLSWKAKEYDVPTHFIQLAGEVNTSMPYYIVERAIDALNEHRKSLNGSKILILGVAYKKDIDDDRESPSYAIMQILQEKGADIYYNDPMVPKLKPGRKHKFTLTSTPLTEEVLSAMDLVMILTDHSEYDYQWIVQHSPLVIDTRNATKNIKNPKNNVIKA